MSTGHERGSENGAARFGRQAELTSFVGRRADLGRVKRLLTDSRLVTLTGAAGVGKSRLARHAAHDLRRSFPGGAYLVSVTELTEPDQIAPAVLAALGVPTDSTADVATTLAQHLVGRRNLLVLDGCEYLVEACGDLVRELLADVRQLRVLITSRSPLVLAGEQVWTVVPLGVPASDRRTEIISSESVRLFAARAAAVSPGFAVNTDNEQRIARLCRELDGLPLAIELAAMWMRSLTVEEILERLDDRYRLLSVGNRDADRQHRSLRAAVDASYELCSATERAVWARLSVFVEGFELDAAEEVCAGDGLDRDDVFNAVAGLVDKSVLAREPAEDERARYRLLRTIRAYGRDRLVDAALRTRLLRRHRQHYLRLAEDLDASWLGPHQVDWLNRLRMDRANLSAALEFGSRDPGEPEGTFRMATALWSYWLASGELAEGWQWLRRTTEPHPDGGNGEPSAPAEPSARGAVVASVFAALCGDTTAAERAAGQAREAGAAVGELAQAEGFVALFDGNLAGAEEAFARAVAEGGEWSMAAALGLPNLALVAVLRADPWRAGELCARCQERSTERGELWCWSWAGAIDGLSRWAAGDAADALSKVREALRVKYLLRDLPGVVFCLEVVAWVEASRGHPGRAARLLSAVEALRPPTGVQLFQLDQFRSWHAEAVERSRTGMPDQAHGLAVERGAGFGLAEAVRVALGGEGSDAAARDVPAQLTPREREVARLVARGLSNREIAERLVIAKRTSDSHIEHILAKLGFSSRAQIAAWVAEQRIEA